MWGQVGVPLALVVAAGQLAAAAQADTYVDRVLDETGQAGESAARVTPLGFAGTASDGRPLESLLFGSVVRTREALGAGIPPRQAIAAGGSWLDMVALSQVQDAGRQAVGVATVARPDVSGWVRVASLPSCQKCAVLAGRWYRWSDGFARHPRCDCKHAPASRDVARRIGQDPGELARAGQVRDLSGAQKAALAQGADFAQVVNAYRRGGLGSLSTTEGARRGRVRLTPEGIYRAADGDRDTAVRLLREHRYLTS